MTGASAALKQVPINDESDLDDYSVEIDVLTQCKHRNVVELYEAYFFNKKLMVRYTLVAYLTCLFMEPAPPYPGFYFNRGKNLPSLPSYSLPLIPFFFPNFPPFPGAPPP